MLCLDEQAMKMYADGLKAGTRTATFQGCQYYWRSGNGPHFCSDEWIEYMPTFDKCHRCCERQATRECVQRSCTWEKLCDTCFSESRERYLYVPPDGRWLL